ncbi:tetratricopeptide repeat protein [Natronosporangium hydrolyticum]|uniref:Tetratricopeptide repeat protein n=1 Tax=Natronosporangium hydrolyticum TaxID=2811111 RepID=A0A895YEJ5_9ACTN|nr:cyclophane-containing RiPP biosynthesis TPR protein HaaT [Natronosporangium hydrolyticum]QSB13829.1 tetratricopeptide repeat protein [Natronosporangium hydrolyticum]
MNPKLRRVTMIILVAAGMAAVTLMVGLVTNAASEQQLWPGPLAYVQQYPWQSLAGLAVVTVALTSLFAVLSAPSPRSTTDAAASPSQLDITVSAIAPVLRTLPRDLHLFANREAEIDELVRSVERVARDATFPIHTVGGMPGAGKTAFAVHVGHLLAPRFPDGQLFLDLNGHTPGRAPVPPSEALASLLLADGVPPQMIPAGDEPWAVNEARAALWRSRIADRRILVILDNAASFQQVEHLLPAASGSLVLVTSRRRLVAPESITLQVGEFEQEDAAALFVRLSARSDLSPEAVTHLVDLCGRLPLAISLLAARLRHHPTWRAGDLERRVRAARSRLSEMHAGERGVAATFDMSYQGLPADRQIFFLRLSACPGQDFDEFAAAALGDVASEVARHHLETLYEYHLLGESDHGRYRFHDLVRDYARHVGRTGLPDDDRAVERLATHYVQALERVNRFVGRSGRPESSRAAARGTASAPAELPPGLDSHAAALAWLDAEHANVLACFEACRTREDHRLVVSLATAMSPYLRHAGPWDRAAHLHRTAAAAARQLGNQAAEAEALANLGMIHRLMADYPAAVEALSQAREAHRAAGDLAGQGQALNQLGILWYLTADYPHAEEAQQAALELCREAGDLLGQANALADLGMVLRMTGQLQPSTEAQTEALALYRRLGDRFGEANALRALGVVCRLTGAYAHAERHTAEALAIYREIDDRVHQAYALNELGAVCGLKGDLAAATSAHEAALGRFRDLGDRFGQAEALRHLGGLRRLKDDLEGAAQAQTQALEIYVDLHSRGGEAAATCELGAIQLLRGDLSAAEEALSRALTTFRQLGDRCGQVEALNHYGDLALAGGDPSTGARHFGQAMDLARATALPLEEADALRGLARCDAATGSREAATENLHAAGLTYRRIGAEHRLSEVGRIPLLGDTGTDESGQPPP